MQTMFDEIMEYYEPIQTVDGCNISYGKLAEGLWGYLLKKLDNDYEHYDTVEKAQTNFRKYLESILKEIEKENTEKELPW